MPSATLVQKRKELEAKQQKLHEVFEQAGDNLDLSKVTVLEGDTKAKAEKIRAMNDELADLAKEVENLAAVEIAAQQAKNRKEGGAGSGIVHPGGGEPDRKGGRVKTFGELFVESDAYKFRAEKKMAELDIELKTVMSTGQGWAPESTRIGRIIEEQVRPIQVTDLIPLGQTGQNAIVYMEETTFTNNAAEVAESTQAAAATYGEAALALTEQTSNVRKIGVWLPLSDEQLEDVPQVRSYVDARLRFMLRQRLDSQILVGNGTAPNLEGINNVSGIQTQAKGSDPTPDAIYKAMTLVRVTGRAMPGAVIMHPNDWQDIRLLRTADGVYIWGNPSEPGPERIWGLPVAQSDAQTENTAVVGDFANFSMLFERRGIEVKITDSHDTFFINGKQAIRADFRVALVWFRPAAFCTVTGI